MSLWSRIAGAFTRSGSGPATGSVGSEFYDWFGEGIEWGDSGVAVNSFTSMSHVAVMACVSILAEDLAKIPLDICRHNTKGGREVATDSYLHGLMRNPNDWQTAFEWKEMMQSALVLRGNAYSVAVRDFRGRVQYLVPVHPDRVALWEAPTGEYFYFVTRNGLHDMAVLAEVPIMVPSEDVLHLRWLSQWNSLLGSSRITLIRESIGLAMGMERHQARFTGQGARPSGVLSTDQKLAAEARNQLKSEWQAFKTGPRNSGATAVLEQGLKWQPMGLTMVDSQFIESRNFQLRDAARAFRVPPYKLGIEGESSGPSMVQQNQQYLNDVVSGYCSRWTSKLEKFFQLDGGDLYFDFDFTHFTKADIQTRYTAYRQAVGGPWMSVNEARAQEDLERVPDGDAVQKPTNMAGLDYEPKDSPAPPGGVGSDTTGTPAEGGDGDANRLPADDKP